MEKEQTIHRFEEAGLGRAPFRCVGIYTLPSPSLAEKNPAAYQAALRDMPPAYRCGTCCYCGMPLMVNYLIDSADGRHFSVGCECVKKTGDEGLRKVADAARLQRDRELREIKRQEAWKAREAARIEKMKAAEAEERAAHGGHTRAELQRMARKAAYAARAEILAPIADVIRDGQRGFRDNLANDIAAGVMPRGRGWDLTIEIYGKTAGGRKGSKAYEAAADVAEAALEQAKAIPEV